MGTSAGRGGCEIDSMRVMKLLWQLLLGLRFTTVFLFLGLLHWVVLHHFLMVSTTSLFMTDAL